MGSIMFCITCIYCMLVLEAEPQIEQPYVNSGLVMEVYNSIFMCSGLCERSK